MSSSIHIDINDFSLPVVYLSNCNIEMINQELKELALCDLDEETAIPCVISIDQEVMNPTFLAQTLECFRQNGLLPIGLKTELDSLKEQSSYAGLALFNQKYKQLNAFANLFSRVDKSNLFDEAKLLTEANNNSQDTPQIVNGNVLAGEQVYAKDKDLIVLGDVLKGAEVIADGNVYIGGSLQGKAYAGNSGMMNIDEISIRAYNFEPQLISIAGFYQLYEDIPTQYIGLAVKTLFERQRFSYQLE
ncbi:septum site-determining protein MinC [Thiomicrorhabdus sp. Milos-T2]|uniref:septum site-determining protein MinC n=1 Tax=Thiomicrorhabdus sp. Milos-T2 TaxID=90814 RepID=UPI00068DEB2C|nr:septum site-determining protein MinC [Thiomicrorhabdus sp. Milos-T2]